MLELLSIEGIHRNVLEFHQMITPLHIIRNVMERVF